MERRRFLQLTVGAAASTALLSRSLRAESPVARLRLRPGSLTDSTIVTVDHTLRGFNLSLPAQGALLELLWEQAGDGKPHWLAGGKRLAQDTLCLQAAERHRLRILNATSSAHQLSLPGNYFMVQRLHQVRVTAVPQRSIQLEKYSAVDVDLLTGSCLSDGLTIL